jgi:MFS family permease
MERSTKLYHGWWIVVLGFFMMALIFAPLLTLPGLFVVPATEELGVERAAFTLHISIAAFVTIFCSLFVGKILTKYNMKLIMFVAAIVAILCFLSYSFSTHLWHFYVTSAVFGVAAVALANVPVAILVNNWFGPKMKGKAMGIAMVGSGVGAMILMPIIGLINSNIGWRWSYRLLALLLLVFLVPLILAVLVRAPGDKGLRRIGDME